jgi:hypothetical protein
VSKVTNSIEINGKRYDSQTGKVLITTLTPKKQGSIDGVFSAKTTPSVKLVVPKTAARQPIKPLSNAKLMDMKPPKHHARVIAKAATNHKTQSSQTLMRHVVTKPTASLKRTHRAISHTDALVAQPVQSVLPKTSVGAVPAARLDRANQAAKSAQINRFAGASASVINYHSVPEASVVQAVDQMPRAAKPLDIFEIALERATSHMQPAVQQSKHPKRQQFLSKRRVSLAATGISLLLILGFMGFENRTNLSLRMAANKAGFSAALPAYQPAGFSVSHLNYSPGNVAIQFRSNSDTRAYAITEKPSSWDSATLRDNFVAGADQQYQTVNVGGRTVYLYGKNNAAWVTAGIWYQVQSDGSLSDQQLSQLASSL